MVKTRPRGLQIRAASPSSVFKTGKEQMTQKEQMAEFSVSNFNRSLCEDEK